MWALHGILYVSAVCALTLDSNDIRSSKETHAAAAAAAAAVAAATPEVMRGTCGNRAQRRASTQERPADTHAHTHAPGHADTHAENSGRARAPEMAACVRSGDCATGLCCVRYLTGKRCQRVPGEGDACLPRGPGKLRRRNLGRCACAAGLICTARTENQRQGVCTRAPERSQSGRKMRRSGKKRRTAEWNC